MTDARKTLAAETAMISIRHAVDTLFRLHALLVAISTDKTATDHIQHLAGLGADTAFDVGNDLDCAREKMEGAHHA